MLLITLFYVLSFGQLALGYGAFSTKLDANVKDCYFEQLKPGDRFDLSYIVGEGGNHEIDFWISAPNSNILHTVLQQSSSSFGFNAEMEGKYSYCFSNERGRDLREVTFTVYGPEEMNSYESGVTRHDDAHQTIDNHILSLSQTVHLIRDDVIYLVNRHLVHTKTAKSTYRRIFWWTLLQLAIILAACGFQIYYLKRFFEVKRLV